MLFHLRMFGVDVVELTWLTDPADDEADVDAVSGLGAVESLHVAEAEPGYGDSAHATEPGFGLPRLAAPRLTKPSLATPYPARPRLAMPYLASSVYPIAGRSKRPAGEAGFSR